mmetsp:Transcript_21378/g.31728  ORF Transcript_21378/g.31728 Transcript_21378/m.31728 type:complete len:104 (-) Transcript_21378:92-403(-)
MTFCVVCCVYLSLFFSGNVLRNALKRLNFLSALHAYFHVVSSYREKLYNDGRILRCKERFNLLLLAKTKQAKKLLLQRRGGCFIGQIPGSKRHLANGDTITTW